MYDVQGTPDQSWRLYIYVSHVKLFICVSHVTLCMTHTHEEYDMTHSSLTLFICVSHVTLFVTRESCHTVRDSHTRRVWHDSLFPHTLDMCDSNIQRAWGKSESTHSSLTLLICGSHEEFEVEFVTHSLPSHSWCVRVMKSLTQLTHMCSDLTHCEFVSHEEFDVEFVTFTHQHMFWSDTLSPYTVPRCGGCD